MITQDPVRIPDIPGRISFSRTEDKEYVRYMTKRKYNKDRKYSEPQRIIIGRRVETAPGLMYPNDNYEKYILEKEEGTMDEVMTPEEQEFIRNNRTYGIYGSFFEALYHEFRQQTRKRPDDPLNRYKAESLNRVLIPLREMMKNEEYAGMLGQAECGGDDGDGGMSCSDVMILLTQYKSALAKYRRGQH